MKNVKLSRLEGCRSGVNLTSKKGVHVVTSGSRLTYNNVGFTLIELLVVVLIIGILASVALPQYNKAVRKARLSEVTSTFNSISKGIDMWLMENGYPADFVTFSGTNKNASLDIAQACVTEDESNCYTKVGRWNYSCSSEVCSIDFVSSYNSDGTNGNKWLDVWLIFENSQNGVWFMSPNSIPENLQSEICRWWLQTNGADRVIMSGEPSDFCSAYL